MPTGVYVRSAFHLSNMKKYKPTQEVRDRISKAHTGKKHTLEHIKNSAKAHEGIVFSKESRDNVSRGLLSFWGNEEGSTLARSKIALTHVGKVESPTTLYRKSQATIRRIRDGDLKYSKGTAQWFTDRLGRRMFLRSSYELQFAQFLDFKCLTWTYQPKAFLDADGIHHMLPDFYVEEFGCYVEIKPRYRLEEYHDMKRVLECVHGKKCYVVTEEELVDLSAWYSRYGT